MTVNPKVNIQEVTELHMEGLNDRQIGELLGCSGTHIAQIRKYILGLPTQESLRDEMLRKEIPRLHSLGLNDAEIARTLKISHSSVQSFRKTKLNLKTHHVERVYLTEEDRVKGYMIRNTKFSSGRRGLDFNLDLEDIKLVEYCPLLNIKLKYRNETGFNDNDRATLDRIDNSKGYVKGNVWILSRLANTMKNESSLDQLKLFCTNTLEFIENHRALGGITQSETVDP